jgi:hypothetical protein
MVLDLVSFEKILSYPCQRPTSYYIYIYIYMLRPIDVTNNQKSKQSTFYFSLH